MIQPPSAPHPDPAARRGPAADEARADAAPAPEGAPGRPAQPDFARVRADIARAAPFDALIYEEEVLAELQTRLRDLRAIPAHEAAAIFGSDADWRQILTRVGVAAGRQLSRVGEMRARLGAAPDFRLDEVARPLADGTTLRWTGD